jgi:hypothetical protein
MTFGKNNLVTNIWDIKHHPSWIHARRFSLLVGSYEAKKWPIEDGQIQGEYGSQTCFWEDA